MSRPAFAIACLVLFPICHTGCSERHNDTIDEPRGPIRPRVTAIDFGGTTMVFEVDLPNDSNAPRRVDTIRYDFLIEDKPFLTRDQAARLTLPARGTATASLPVRIDYGELYRRHEKLSDDAEADYELRIDAENGESADAGIASMNYRGRCPLLKPPRFEVGDTDFDNDGWTAAKVSMEVKVTNPNVFTIGIDELGYELVMGGSTLGRLKASSRDEIAPDATGRVRLRGKISAGSLIGRLLRGDFDDLRVIPIGAIRTPYGRVTLDPVELRQMFRDGD